MWNVQRGKTGTIKISKIIYYCTIGFLTIIRSTKEFMNQNQTDEVKNNNNYVTRKSLVSDADPSVDGRLQFAMLIFTFDV